MNSNTTPENGLDWICVECQAAFDARPPSGCDNCGQPRVVRRVPVLADQTKARKRTSVGSMENARYTEIQRWKTGIDFFDEATGGGIPRGKTILFAGQKGAGKSTLQLGVINGVANATKRHVLIASSEETAESVKNRASRLGYAGNHRIKILARRGLTIPEVMAAVEEVDPVLVLVDSVQELGDKIKDDEKAQYLAEQLGDQRGISTIIIGQYTKDGGFAGTNKLGHRVDAIMELGLNEVTKMRSLNTIKNRDGIDAPPISLRMTARGLVRASGATGIEADDRDCVPPGCVVCPVTVGAGLKLVEILCALGDPLTAHDGDDGSTIKAPKRGDRKAIKIDSERVKMMAAGLEKLGLDPSRDIHVEAVIEEDVTITDRGADLAIAAAIVSADLGIPIPRDAGVFGSVDVMGKISEPSRTDERLRALYEHGYHYGFMRAHKGKSPVVTHEVRELADLRSKTWPIALPILKEAKESELTPIQAPPRQDSETDDEPTEEWPWDNDD